MITHLSTCESLPTGWVTLVLQVKTLVFLVFFQQDKLCFICWVVCILVSDHHFQTGAVDMPVLSIYLIYFVGIICFVQLVINHWYSVSPQLHSSRLVQHRRFNVPAIYPLQNLIMQNCKQVWHKGEAGCDV